MSSQFTSIRRSHAERTSQSDQRMFLAAVELITEKGPENMTLKSVGERAGYSRGLAGYRFGSKQGLFEFVMHRVGEQWLKQLSSVTRGLSGIDAMRAAVIAHRDLCGGNALPVQAFYRLWMSAVSPGADTLQVVHNIDQRRQQDVSQWVLEANPTTDSGQATAIATQFSSTIIGIVYHWLANPSDVANVHSQHDQLIQTMTQLMQPGTHS